MAKNARAEKPKTADELAAIEIGRKIFQEALEVQVVYSDALGYKYKLSKYQLPYERFQELLPLLNSYLAARYLFYVKKHKGQSFNGGYTLQYRREVIFSIRADMTSADNNRP
jgi:hypothetical protein